MSIGNFFTGFGAADQINGGDTSFGGRMLAGMMASQGGLEQMVDQNKRISAGGKAADAFREFAGGDDEAALGVHDSAWKNMSATDKMGVVQGYMQNQQSQMDASKMQEFAAQAQQRIQAANDDTTAYKLLNEFSQARGSDPQGPIAPQFLDDDGKLNDQGAYMMALSKVGKDPNAGLNARSIGTFQKLAEGPGGGMDTKPKVSMLDVGNPTDPDYHRIPWISQGKVGQIDPAYTLGIKQNNAEDLIDDKAAMAPEKGAVTPEDQFNDLGAQIKSLRGIPATMRTPDENDQLANLLQKQQRLVTKSATAAAPAAEAPPGSLPRVGTKKDFDALPKGAKYIGKDGRQYQKP
jgi:hypothetical protein